MSVKFIHCSDLHLGRQRLGGNLPDSDLKAAFQYIVTYTLEQQADALLIAGDIFDSPNIQPPCLHQATECLKPLQQAGVPVFAIEGNHDRATISGDSPTWVRYLNDIGLLHLLSIPFNAAGPVITPWDPQTRAGSYIDFKGIRLVGAGYLGAGTIKRAKLIAEQMAAWQQESSPGAVVMLLHAGPDYMVQEGGGFAKESLEFLKESVDYLALGHIHKPMIYEGWAINPGSPEHIRLEESRYDSKPRGLAVVEIDPQADNPLQRAEILAVPKRQVLTLHYDCTPHSNRTKRAMELISEEITVKLKELGVGPEAAIRLELTGSVNLGRIRLDTAALAECLVQQVPVKAVEVNSAGLKLATNATDSELASVEATSREDLELLAIHGLVADKPLPGLEEQVESLARLFYLFKEDVRHHASAQEIRERLTGSDLVDRLVAEEMNKLPIRSVAAAKDGEA
ncbi:metallophosphoesterase family protein [Desulforamulus aeronauticus]|uniref:Nuclease SbcCD subunit D n=1 Tax=Desulforamulus aeronauticus DSM 10349 TaxID=1121421 RepID=A0A1M6TXF4_9FIRM|nr:DNA repair exonuclease [Desulforamulus aeronauticus]SHK61570.1 DNA repair exonuclease SbcCD nuclease subunit [Desulforamulus aeronauticus DSM 10349]